MAMLPSWFRVLVERCAGAELIVEFLIILEIPRTSLEN